MIKCIGYKVIRGYEDYVTEEVLKLLNEGWSLHGNPHFEPYHAPDYSHGYGYGGDGRTPEATMYQTVVKYAV